jgi:hypothetical protein
MMAAIVDPRFYFITDGRGVEIEMFSRDRAQRLPTTSP